MGRRPLGTAAAEPDKLCRTCVCVQRGALVAHILDGQGSELRGTCRLARAKNRGRVTHQGALSFVSTIEAPGERGHESISLALPPVFFVGGKGEGEERTSLCYATGDKHG